MNSRLFFRETGQVIRTRSRGREVLTVVVGVVVAVVSTVLLLAWGHAADQDDDGQGAFEAGLVVGGLDMQQAVADAYRQGRVDALAELFGAQGQCAAPQADGRQGRAL